MARAFRVAVLAPVLIVGAGLGFVLWPRGDGVVRPGGKVVSRDVNERRRDDVRGEAHRRITALGVELGSVGECEGKACIAALIRRRAAGGKVIRPADYFSPYHRGKIPEPGAYAHMYRATSPAGSSEDLTSYEVPAVRKDSADPYPLVGDFLGPRPIVFMSDWLIREIGAYYPHRKPTPSDREILAAFGR